MSKEENIESIERAAKTVQITGRVSQAVKDEFEQLREAGGYETFYLFMEALLERYNNPLKINKANAGRIAELEEKIKEYKADNAAACETINDERAEFEALKAEHNQALAKIEDLQRELSDNRQAIDNYDTLRKETQGCMSVPVSEMDRKCLQYLAERECRERKRTDITPPVFFQYAIREIFIKGNRFSIPSVPNHILRKFEEEIKNGK